MGDEKHDVDGLLRKNGELLAEVKALKAKVTELEGERDGAKADADTAQAMTRSVSIERPLEAVLGNSFVAPWRIVRPMLDEHFSFDLSDEGGAVVTARGDEGEGEAIPLSQIGHRVNAIADLSAMLKPPTGGGGRGSTGAGNIQSEEKTPRKVASPFGLR